MFGAFFPDNSRQKLEEDLWNIQQGDRIVLEYIREFTQLLNRVPYVARDKVHRIYIFERGLR